MPPISAELLKTRSVAFDEKNADRFFPLQKSSAAELKRNLAIPEYITNAVLLTWEKVSFI
jgi:hypothetical protein